jgi:hypothetical protein
MSNLSAKSMSDLGSLIKTAEVNAYETTYSGPSLEERLTAVALTEPLHKVINAVLRDRKARSTLEIHAIVKDRGFSEQEVRATMQNVYKRQLVVTLPAIEAPGIRYRISAGEFWPEDIVSPTPAVTMRAAATVAKAKLKELPKFDAHVDPSKDIVAGDRVELAIWKLFQDGAGRRTPEIVEALRPYQYDARTVKNGMQRLINLKWFDYDSTHQAVRYTLKKEVAMPSNTGPLEAVKPPIELPTLANGKLVLDLQKDGIRRTIHKIMSDGLRRTNVELAEILAPMCDTTQYLKYEMMQLVKLDWFDREETSHPVGHYPIIVYKLKADVRRPDPEAITATSKFYKTPSSPADTLAAIDAVLKDDQRAAPAQASLLPAAPDSMGDLSVAQSLGMGSNVVALSNVSAGAREALSRGLGGITSNGIVPETTGVSLKDPVINPDAYAAEIATRLSPPSGVWPRTPQVADEPGDTIDVNIPLVEVCVKIAGKSITPAQADEIVDELTDLGFGDERNMIQSRVIKVKLELAGTEFCLEDVDKIVKHLKEEGFGKHRKN